MSDFILARVSQTLAAEQSLETLVRQLLEMLEAAWEGAPRDKILLHNECSEFHLRQDLQFLITYQQHTLK